MGGEKKQNLHEEKYLILLFRLKMTESEYKQTKSVIIIYEFTREYIRTCKYVYSEPGKTEIPKIS